MPRKSAEEEELASLVSTNRASMSITRTCLLQFLDKVKMDIVELDHDRFIVRTKTVSCKRITRPVVDQIIADAFKALTELDTAPAALDVLAFMKGKLKEHIEKVAWKGNVLPAEHHETKRTIRDGAKIRRGTFSLVDPQTREIAETAWREAHERAQLATKSKILRNEKPVVAPPSPQLSATEVAEQSPSSQLTSATPMVSIAKRSPTTAACPAASPAPRQQHRKPRNSISKGESTKLFQLIAEFISSSFKDPNLPSLVAEKVDAFFSR